MSKFKRAYLLFFAFLISILLLTGSWPATAAEAASTAAGESAEKARVGNDGALKTDYLSLTVPGGWHVEDLDDKEDLVYIRLLSSSAELPSESEVIIEISGEDDTNWRRRLVRETGHLDYEDVAEEILPTVLIDEKAFYCSEDSADLIKSYFYRDPGSGLTVLLTVKAGELETDVEALLNSISFHLPVKGLVDPPAPSNGKALSLTSKPVRLSPGGKDVQLSYLSEEDLPLLPYETPLSLGASDDTLYLLSENTLFSFQMQSPDHAQSDSQADTSSGVKYGELESEQLFALVSSEAANGADGLAVLSDGRVLLTRRFAKATLRETGETVSDLRGFLSLSPDRSYAFSYWLDTDVMMYSDVSDFPFSGEPWVLTDLYDDDERQGPFDSIDALAVADDLVAVAGFSSDRGEMIMAAYKKDGSERWQTALFSEGEDVIGEITAIDATDDLLTVLTADGSLLFYSVDGKRLASQKLSEVITEMIELTGQDLVRLPDGTLLIAATALRPDRSAAGILFFRLTGK